MDIKKKTVTIEEQLGKKYIENKVEILIMLFFILIFIPTFGGVYCISPWIFSMTLIFI